MQGCVRVMGCLAYTITHTHTHTHTHTLLSWWWELTRGNSGIISRFLSSCGWSSSSTGRNNVTQSCDPHRPNLSCSLDGWQTCWDAASSAFSERKDFKGSFCSLLFCSSQPSERESRICPDSGSGSDPCGTVKDCCGVFPGNTQSRWSWVRSPDCWKLSN